MAEEAAVRLQAEDAEAQKKWRTGSSANCRRAPKPRIVVEKQEGSDKFFVVQSAEHSLGGLDPPKPWIPQGGTGSGSAEELQAASGGRKRKRSTRGGSQAELKLWRERDGSQA